MTSLLTTAAIPSTMLSWAEALRWSARLSAPHRATVFRITGNFISELFDEVQAGGVQKNPIGLELRG
jgi:hypothetical protein